MKSLTITTSIQFDQYSEIDSVEYAVDTIEKINKVLQREFNDISPIIFSQNISCADIYEFDGDSEE